MFLFSCNGTSLDWALQTQETPKVRNSLKKAFHLPNFFQTDSNHQDPTSISTHPFTCLFGFSPSTNTDSERLLQWLCLDKSQDVLSHSEQLQVLSPVFVPCLSEHRCNHQLPSSLGMTWMLLELQSTLQLFHFVGYQPELHVVEIPPF